MEKKSVNYGLFLNAANILFVLLWLVQLLPNRTEGDEGRLAVYTMVVVTVVEAIFIIISIAAREKPIYITAGSISATIFAVLLAWTLATAKSNLLNESMFPSPEVVFRQLVSDTRLPGDVLSSVITLGKGYLSALALGLVLGSLAGMSRKLSDSLTYITSFLKLIPPVVYIPYAIALLPHYDMVSTFVIFMASFWPIFSCTFAGVSHVDKQYLDSAQVLNVDFLSKIIYVILPASLPEIFIGCNQALAYSLILLTSAEMIGGSSGIGYYIKYYSNFGDFKRIIVGILVLGVTICLLTFFINKLEKYLLRWRAK